MELKGKSQLLNDESDVFLESVTSLSKNFERAIKSPNTQAKEVTLKLANMPMVLLILQKLAGHMEEPQDQSQEANQSNAKYVGDMNTFRLSEPTKRGTSLIWRLREMMNRNRAKEMRNQ